MEPVQCIEMNYSNYMCLIPVIAPPHHYSSGFQVIYNVTVQERGETYTGVGLNWTTTGRPVGNVQWLIGNGNIQSAERHLTMDVLRSKVNVTYDHVLIIPWKMLDGILPLTYSIHIDPCTVNITTPEITLLPGKRFYMYVQSMYGMVHGFHSIDFMQCLQPLLTSPSTLQALY